MPKKHVCPQTLWLPLGENIHIVENHVSVIWDEARAWQNLGRIQLPALLTLDLDVLTKAFVTCFFNNPKSEELIARQDQWHVDVRAETAKPLAGVFEPVVRAMERENKRRLAALTRLRLLEAYDAPDASVACSWISFEVPGALKTCLLGQVQPGPTLLLEWFAYYRSLFGPERPDIQDVWRDLFLKGAHLKGRPTPWVFLKTLEEGEEARALHSHLVLKESFSIDNLTSKEQATP